MKQYSAIIIGAGPAGIGAAVTLSNAGLDSVAVIERHSRVGGIPSFYKKKKGGVRTFVRWSKGGMPVFGTDYANLLESQLSKTKAEVKTDSQVISIDTKTKTVTYVNPTEGKQTISANAVIMACGSREKTQAERGWISGSRPSGVMFTKQLISLLDERGVLPFKNPVILGSDLLAYAAAAKLKNAGANNPVIIDRTASPICSFPERLYFRMWTNPSYVSTHNKTVEITGGKYVTGVRFGGTTVACDGVMICGELSPNTELAVSGNLKVDAVTRIPQLTSDFGMSDPGWYAAGNISGGFHGAEWCYFNGCKAARKLLKDFNK